MKFLFGGNKTKQAKSAIDKMAKLRDVDGLSNALRDPDWQIREYAAGAFEQIGISDNPSIKARYLVAKRSFSEVLSIGNPAKEPLLLALVHSNARVQFDAADALIKICNVDAVQPIIDSIPRMDYRYVANIAFLLGKFNDSITADKLIIALKSSDAHVRWVAAYALGEMGDSRALSTLEQMAENDEGKTSDDGPVKNAARIAFQKIQWRDRSLDQLINALSNSDEFIRFGATDALGRLGDTSSVNTLISCLNDPNRMVRETVIAALGKIGDTRAIAPLTTMARSKDGGYRWDAINAIENIAGTPLDIFLDMLSDPNDRYTAVVRIGRSNDPRAISALERVLKEEKNEGIKKFAKKSIEEIQQRINDNK